MEYQLYLLLIFLHLSYSVTGPVNLEKELYRQSCCFNSRSEIEMFKPFYVYPDSMSSVSSQLEDIQSITKTYQLSQRQEFEKILTLNTKITQVSKLSMGLEELSSPFNRQFPWFLPNSRFSPQVFSIDGAFGKSIQSAIGILKNCNFLNRDTIWALAVLRHLEGYLPNGELRPIKTNMKEGPISYVALLLHLTRDIDLVGGSSALWEHKKPPRLMKIDPTLAEAALRLKIIIFIISQFKQNAAIKSSKFIVELYDVLLQERCPMQPENLKNFLLLCSSHVRGKDVSDSLVLEEGLAYTVLNLYSEIYPTVGDFIDMEKLQNKHFRFRFVYEDIFQDLSSKFNSWKRHQFDHLLHPLIHPKNWNMNNLKRVIDAMIHSRHGATKWGGIPSLNYVTLESEVIRVLVGIASVIDDDTSYLEARVEKINQSPVFFSLKIPGLQLEDTGQNCPICLDPIHPEEAFVDVHGGNPPGHIFHKDCFEGMIQPEPGRQVHPMRLRCPLCRRKLRFF